MHLAMGVVIVIAFSSIKTKKNHESEHEAVPMLLLRGGGVPDWAGGRGSDKGGVLETRMGGGRVKHNRRSSDA